MDHLCTSTDRRLGRLLYSSSDSEAGATKSAVSVPSPTLLEAACSCVRFLFKLAALKRLLSPAKGCNLRGSGLRVSSGRAPCVRRAHVAAV
jgi:hypothetical protein